MSNFNWTDVREVDDLRVEIHYNREMMFPASAKSGAQWVIDPGIAIKVTESEPYGGSLPDSEDYPTLAYEKDIMPGRSIHHPDMRNKIGGLGASTFEPIDGDELERWLAPRVDRLVRQAHRLRLQRDIGQQLAQQIKREEPRLEVEVDYETGVVQARDSYGWSAGYANLDEWTTRKWEVGAR